MSCLMLILWSCKMIAFLLHWKINCNFNIHLCPSLDTVENPHTLESEKVLHLAFHYQWWPVITSEMILISTLPVHRKGWSSPRTFRAWTGNNSYLGTRQVIRITENERDLSGNEHCLSSNDLWVQCSNTELTSQPGAGHYVGSEKTHGVMNKWL